LSGRWTSGLAYRSLIIDDFSTGLYASRLMARPFYLFPTPEDHLVHFLRALFPFLADDSVLPRPDPSSLLSRRPTGCYCPRLFPLLPICWCVLHRSTPLFHIPQLLFEIHFTLTSMAPTPPEITFHKRRQTWASPPFALGPRSSCCSKQFIFPVSGTYSPSPPFYAREGGFPSKYLSVSSSN